MHETAFLDAVRPARRVILRLLMLPYSIGHEILLAQRKNPLVQLSQEDFNKLTIEQQCAAVIEAALICSRTWKQNQRQHKWVKLWGWFIRKEDFALAIAEFRIYRAEGSTWPMIAPLDDSEKGRELGSPYLARILSYATTVYGENALDAALGLSQWLYFAHAESEGACRVENEMEEAVRTQKAAILEDIERERQEIIRKQKEAQCQAS